MGELNEKLKDPAYAAEFFLAGVDVHHENKDDADFKVAVDNCRKAIRDTKAERDRYKAKVGGLKELLEQAGSTIHLTKYTGHPGNSLEECTDVACVKIAKAIQNTKETSTCEETVVSLSSDRFSGNVFCGRPLPCADHPRKGSCVKNDWCIRQPYHDGLCMTQDGKSPKFPSR